MNNIILNIFYDSQAIMQEVSHKKKLENTAMFEIFNTYSKMSSLP